MMQTDVNSANLSASGSVSSARTRVRGILVVPGGSAGSVVLKDGGSGGTTKITLTTLASGTPFNVNIPANGVLFETDVYATISNAAVTVFYG